MNSSAFSRFKTRIVSIGNLPIGGNYPIRVQSMTNTDTLDVDATAAQVIRLIEQGCEYVRIAIPGMKEIECLKKIKRKLRRNGFSVPLIADVHFNPKIAVEAAKIVEKVRINPGNYQPSSGSSVRARKSSVSLKSGIPDLDKSSVLEQIADRLVPLLKICKEYGTAVRIGVNHGSLSQRILYQYGNTAEGMVESLMEFAQICREEGFDNLVLSLKASNTQLMIRSNRLLVEKMKQEGMEYPIHLGVTEAGAGDDGRLKSAIGIGSLLADGIGDTIRVSITETPENEIPVAYAILQAIGVRISRADFISCPTCARTHFNIEETAVKIKSHLGHLTGLKIAVMGCVVNGPGEMADADYGYVGGARGKVMLYKGRDMVIKDVNEADALETLIRLIKENGDWKEPPRMKNHP